MPIKVACQCGQQFAAKDELAGKTVKCPSCSQPLTIPAAQSAGASDGMGSLLDEAGMDAASATQVRCPSCSAVMQPGAVLCVACGYNINTGRRLVTQHVTDDFSGDDEEIEGVIPATGNVLLDKAARELRKEEIESTKQWTGLPWWVLLIMLIAMLAFTTTMMLIDPTVAMTISMIMFIVLFGIASLAMQVWLIIIAFSESVTCGILFLLCGPYQLYYIFTRWDQCGTPAILAFLLSFLNGGAFAALEFLVPMLAEDNAQLPPVQPPAAMVVYAAPGEFSNMPPAVKA